MKNLVKILSFKKDQQMTETVLSSINNGQLQITKNATYDMNSLSVSQLQHLSDHIAGLLKEKSINKKDPTFVALKKELGELEKELKGLYKNKVETTIMVPVALTAELAESGYITALGLAEGEGLYFTGKLDLGKSADLSKAQARVLASNIESYFSDVCDDFVEHFIPEDVKKGIKDLEKRAEDWRKKIEKAGYSTENFE